jgi:HEAT repeat protein
MGNSPTSAKDKQSQRPANPEAPLHPARPESAETDSLTPGTAAVPAAPAPTSARQDELLPSSPTPPAPPQDELATPGQEVTAIADAPETKPVPVAEPKVKDEVEIQIDLLKDKDWFRRKDAAITLGEMGDERAIAPLLTAFRDSEWNVREAAQDALAQIGPPAVEPLIRALREYQIKTFVIQVLGKIKDERVLDPLMVQLRNEEFKDVATKALVEVGLPAVERLMAVLNDKDKNVRKHAVIALGEIGVSEAIEPLIDATRDEDWTVRLQAIAALDLIGDDRGKPAVKALMKDPDFAVQMRAERIIWDWKKKRSPVESEEERAGSA